MISQPFTIIRANKIGKPYVQTTDPSTSHTIMENDIWLNPDAGTMKTWDGSQWVEMQFGESALLDNCITNRLIANGINASKITAGILQSQDGSFYLNLENGEAELLNLVMGGRIEGNIVATSSNGLTRVRLRGQEGSNNVTAGIIFEQREESDDAYDWQNAGQMFFDYNTRKSCSDIEIYRIGKYNSGRPYMGYNSGSADGLMWRMLSQDWLKAGMYTYHGARLMSRESTSDNFANVTPVNTVIGDIIGGTSIVGNGIATLTYKFNDIMQIDFNVKITTSGSGSDVFGLSQTLIRTLDVSLPSLVPLSGGTLQIFNSSGALVTSYTGASFTADANGVYWIPSYISGNTLTTIAESALTSGMTLVGTCYGSYTFDEGE